ILFVTNGHLSEGDRATYDLLNKVIFDENIARYTTIVRTNFPGFNNEIQREMDKERILQEDGRFGKLIKACKGIIYVDNPSIDVDEKELQRINISRREKSRDILLGHLDNICPDSGSSFYTYRPSNLIKL